MVLLIDNYDSFTYNLYQVIEKLGFHCQVARNDSLTLEQIANLNPDRIIISPGPGEPTSAGISLATIQKFAGKIPLLGVCLGHQAIGHVYGAEVVRAPKPRHGKMSKILHDGLGVYKGISGPFLATRYHSLILDRKTLPDSLVVTSETEDGIIMGVRHRKLAVEGVQFHPESIATEGGEKLIENFLRNAG